MHSHRRCVLTFILALPSIAVAQSGGIWSGMAMATHDLVKGKCKPVQEAEAMASLSDQVKCEVSRGTSNFRALSDVGTRITGSEDAFFMRLAEAHARELECGAKFGDELAKGEPRAIKIVVDAVEALRQARRQHIQAVKDLHASGAVTNRLCPLTKGELDTSAYANLKFNALCERQQRAKAAYEMIQASLPLVGETHVNQMATQYANRTDGLPEAELTALVKKTYGESASTLRRQSQSLVARVSKDGARSFSDAEKHTLLDDPLLKAEIIDRDKDHIDPVACTADAKFGSGADIRDGAIGIGSLVLGSGAVAAAKLGSVAINASRGALLARAAGAISLTTSRVLGAGALVATAATAATEVNKLCAHHRMAQKASGSKACVSAPKIEELQYESCALAAALSATDLASFVPATKLAMAVPAAQKIVNVVAGSKYTIAKDVLTDIGKLPAAFRVSDADLDILHKDLATCKKNKNDCAALLEKISAMKDAIPQAWTDSVERLRESLLLKVMQSSDEAAANASQSYDALESCLKKHPRECLETYDKAAALTSQKQLELSTYAPPTKFVHPNIIATTTFKSFTTHQQQELAAAMRQAMPGALQRVNRHADASLVQSKLSNPDEFFNVVLGSGDKEIRAAGSKAIVTSASSTHTLLFDPVQPYVTVKTAAGDYVQYVVDSKTKKFRPAVGSEIEAEFKPKTKSRSDAWVRQTHFRYRP